MAVSPRVFISFSSKDRRFVRKLFFRLKSQNVDVWDYSQSGSEIPLGKEIPDILKEKINQSDFFIPILSKNSMDPTVGRYVRIELEHALSKGLLKQGRILPLVLMSNPPKAWENEYSSLESTMHLDIDPDDQRQFEESIARISATLKVPYIPPFVSHERFPFSERFEREIKTWNLEIALFNELLVIVNEFSRQYNDAEYFEANQTITYFLLTCRYRLPKFKPYYPLIVKGVCDLHLGNFIEAEETFIEATHHSLSDENSHGGLGQVYFRQGRYEESLKAYEEALQRCPAEENKEILFNILGTLLKSGHKPIDISFMKRFDESKMTKEERINFLNMKGIAFFNLQDFESAKGVFEKMKIDGAYDSTTVIYHYQSLTAMGRGKDGLKLLQNESEKLGTTAVLHYLAHAYWHEGRDDEAIQVYENKLLKMQPKSRQYWIEYARMLKQGNPRKMKETCIDMLTGRSFPLPKSLEDFYYDGFANFLIGENQRARYDFERSGDFCEYYYDQIRD
jgi:tetratricopeptide (TPR) repeat protein